jgi:hypothetical protein
LTFAGSISPDEMAAWVEDSKNVLAGQTSKFGVLVAMRDLSPLTPSAKEKMQEGQILYKEKGMVRSAVVVSQGFLATQFKMIAQQTGIYEWERYIDSESNPNWEQVAIDWIKNGKDFDIK